MTATACTGGMVVINLYEHWRSTWSRAWSDLGRLHHAHETETHIAAHEVSRGGWCQCWECRVFVAWETRHAVAKRRRRP